MANLRHEFVSGKADGSDPTVVKPSDWNAKIVYADNTGAPTVIPVLVRQALTATTTFYTRAGGLDDPSHSGLANTDAQAWKTIFYAADRISNEFDMNGKTCILQHDGSALSDVVISSNFVGAHQTAGVTTGVFIFDGGGATISGVSQQALLIDLGGENPQIEIRNMTIVGGTQNGLVTFDGAFVYIGTGITFGAANGQIFAQDHSRIFDASGYSISGSANVHASAAEFSSVEISAVDTLTVTFTNPNLNFGSGFVNAIEGGFIFSNAVWGGNSASVTGPRFSIATGGTIETGTGSLTYFPGNAIGFSDGSGSYDGIILGDGGRLVSDLPPAASTPIGTRLFVTNSTSAVFNAIAGNGGANIVPVFNDGTNWRVG